MLEDLDVVQLVVGLQWRKRGTSMSVLFLVVCYYFADERNEVYFRKRTRIFMRYARVMRKNNHSQACFCGKWLLHYLSELSTLRQRTDKQRPSITQINYISKKYFPLAIVFP